MSLLVSDVREKRYEKQVYEMLRMSERKFIQNKKEFVLQFTVPEGFE
jgi:hypothetical protein